MNILQEGHLTFQFPAELQVIKYDDTTYYRNQFNSCFGGAKATDFLAIDSINNSGWLIEVKDYRYHERTKSLDLCEEIAFKLRDSLAGLACMKNSANEQQEKFFANAFLKMKKFRVVLHLEQKPISSTVFNEKSYYANLQQKLKQLIKAVDAHPKVLNISLTQNSNVNWQVR